MLFLLAMLFSAPIQIRFLTGVPRLQILMPVLRSRAKVGVSLSTQRPAKTILVDL
jgi:hypothetical protein